MQRKKHPADFKAKVSLEAIRESRIMAASGAVKMSKIRRFKNALFFK